MAFNLLCVTPKRTVTSFFNRRTGEDLWKSVFSVSSQGRKKGRGRVAGKMRDLNRGQRIGEGPVRVQLPGYHDLPSGENNKVQWQPFSQLQYSPPDPNREQRLLDIQKDIRRNKRKNLHSLLRGYSGNKTPGRKLGWPMVDAAAPNSDLPSAIVEEVKQQLQQFQTVCLFAKNRRIMTSIGRAMESRAVMCVGNGNGIAGYADEVENDLKSAIRKATSSAIKNLRHVELLNNRTIYQDFFAECQGVRLFVQRMPEGYGLVGHRVLQLICQLVGIKDLYMKVDGNPSNYSGIARAFFQALADQETYQRLAERKRLHVVEFRRENMYLPTIVASPEHSKCRTDEEIAPDEVLELTELYGSGRYTYKKKVPPFWTYLESYKRKLYVELPRRNHPKVEIRLLAEGAVKDLSLESKIAHREEQFKKLLNGEIKLPVGLGLTNLYSRDDWLAENDK